MNLADLVRKLQKDISELQKLINRAMAASTGEANTASNIGAGGVGPYDSKVGVNLRFRNINTASARLSVALDAPNNEIDLDVVQAQIVHGSIGGLAADDHIGYARLAGRAGGQVLYGGTGDSEDLWLCSTSHAVKGTIFFGIAGTSVFLESTNYWGFGTATPNEKATVEGRLSLRETTDPAATANYGKIWVSSADGLPYFMDSDGVVYELLAGSGGGGGGAPIDAEYIVGAANGSLSAERVKSAIYDNYDLADYPAVPDALDDEFEDGAIDVKWTIVNDPGAPNAVTEAKYAGHIWVGLPELGTDNFDNLVRLYQAPPAGNQTMEFIARVSIGMSAHLGSADDGEYCGAYVYLGNSVDDQVIAVGIGYNNSLSGSLPVQALGQQDNLAAWTATGDQILALPTRFFYIKLNKTTANAYDAANTYEISFSADGITWHQVGSKSYTFTTPCDEVGVFFRCPKAQAGAPLGEAAVDFFRRTA